MAYGQSGHLAVSFQNSFGTSNTNSAYYIPLISESIAETINQVVEKNIYSRLAEPPTHEGTHEIGGDIRTETHPIGLGVFLKATLGRVTTSAQGSAFSHEFLPVGSDFDGYAAVPPMTMEVNRDVGSAFLYSDMLGNNLVLEIAQGQLLSAAMTVVGAGFSRKSPGSPDFKPGRPWSWDVTSASYDGSGISDLRQLSITFDNQLAPQFTISSGKYPSRIKREGAQTVTVEGTMLLRDQALYDEFLAQAEKELVINFAGETIATSYQTELKLEIPKLRFTEFSPQLSGAGQLEVSFSGKGIFDTNSDYALRIVLTNTHQAY